MTISVPPKGDADKKIGADFAPLSVSAQNTPNMTVKVRAGWFYNTDGTPTEYPGGNSAVIPAPGSNAYWVLVYITNAGSVAFVASASAPIPALPAVPAGTMPLAFVYVTSATIALTNDKIYDARPLFRGTDLVPNLAAELANRPTFADVATDLAGKADVDGTPNFAFALNKANAPAADASLSVNRGISLPVAIRWNEGTQKWQFTNDGTTYVDMASVAGVFMNLVAAPTAGHVLTTDALGQAVDSGTALAALETVAAATASLALKADKVVAAVAGDVATLNGSGNLVDGGVLLSALATTAALTLKANDSAVVHNTGIETIAGAKTFSSNVTINDGPVGTPTMVFGNFSGDMGFEVTRAAFPAAPALLKWDETSITWQVGVVGGPMDSILTASVVAGKVDRTDTLQLTGEVTVGPSALTGPANSFAAALSATGVAASTYGNASNVATFTVDTKGRLTLAGNVAIAITGANVTVAGFTSGHVVSLDASGHPVDSGVVAAGILHTGDIGSTVEAFDATILKSADIGSTVEAFDATILKSADIGSTVEAWSAVLDSVAALASSAGLIARTAGTTVTGRSITSTGATITVSNGDGVAGNPNVDLPAVGTAGTYNKVTTDTQGRVSSGAALFLKNTKTTNFGGGPIVSLTSAADTVTVTGAVVGDVVSLGLPAAPDAGLMFDAWVSAPNTVTIRANNVSVGAVSPSSFIYNVVVTQYGNV